MQIHSIVISLLALSLASSVQAQEVTRIQVGDNQNYGITYHLPATRLHIEARATCTQVKAGIFAPYAEKYLGMSDVPQEDQIQWTLDEVSLSTRTIADTSRTYHIQFSEKLALPVFYLTDDGRLQGINAQAPAPVQAATLPFVAAEEVKPSLHAQQVMSEELLKAGSRSKQAEIAARQIFRIRESRLNLLTGDVDNLPADGASFQLVLDNLQAQEAAYMELFTGVRSVTYTSRSFDYYPSAATSSILFRFSSHFGFVDADDLSGEPCRLSVVISEDRRQVPVLRDAKGKVLPVATGIAHCVPGRAHVAVVCHNKVLAEGDWTMPQFGHVEFLPSTYFTNKKAPAAALFDLHTGAIEYVGANNN